MLNPLAVKIGAELDLIGRSLLTALDARLYGFLALGALGLFYIWRKWRYKSYPTHRDCMNFVYSLVEMIGGFTVMVVFLFTSPPAIELLSAATLALLGILVPILIFGKTGPQLKSLLFPPEAPKPPKE